MATYKALQVIEKAERQFERKIVELKIPIVNPKQVLIKVHYSSLNYKDFLSSIGNKGVTRKFPHVPGVDASGVVVESHSDLFSAGDEVIVTGYDLGMNTDGGFGEYILSPQEWVVPKPTGITLEEAMIYGTAGFTAAQSVEELLSDAEKNQRELKSGEIVVTGASGGVGSVAVMILTHLGYSVHAISGKQGDFLKKSGVKKITTPKDWQNSLDEKKPLLKEMWLGGIDTVGGDILRDILRTASYRSMITCCGMVAGINLTTSIFPFILRGVKLVGIDSAACPLHLKKKIWEKLADAWKPSLLHEIKKVISLNELEKNLLLMQEGKLQGRTVLRHDV